MNPEQLMQGLGRMGDKRKYIIENLEAYRQQLIEKKLPDDFDERTEEEQERIIGDLENIVASIDPIALQDEIISLGKLIKLAKDLEKKKLSLSYNV